MEYILFIHNNTESDTSKEEWDSFFDSAIQSGLFRGGSEIGNRSQLGRKPVTDITVSIGGFMRFETEDFDSLVSLLEQHPVVTHGGTLELCELPKTDA
ncbi:MAG: hypothetical protein AAF358_19785 [Pseudomonadota bacterium]